MISLSGIRFCSRARADSIKFSPLWSTARWFSRTAQQWGRLLDGVVQLFVNALAAYWARIFHFSLSFWKNPSSLSLNCPYRKPITNYRLISEPLRTIFSTCSHPSVFMGTKRNHLPPGLQKISRFCADFPFPGLDDLSNMVNVSAYWL